MNNLKLEKINKHYGKKKHAPTELEILL